MLPAVYIYRRVLARWALQQQRGWRSSTLGGIFGRNSCFLRSWPFSAFLAFFRRKHLAPSKLRTSWLLGSAISLIAETRLAPDVFPCSWSEMHSAAISRFVPEILVRIASWSDKRNHFSFPTLPARARWRGGRKEVFTLDSWRPFPPSFIISLS